MLKALRHRKQCHRFATALCVQLSLQARNPKFYAEYGVSDTVDGRFDLLVLHAWMILDALQTKGELELAQALVDSLFSRFDEGLREQGAGDMSMNRRMKTMASAFYGRLSAYGGASGETGLAEALLRNVYRGTASRIEQATRLAKYTLAARAHLAHSRLTLGEADFGPVSP